MDKFDTSHFAPINPFMQSHWIFDEPGMTLQVPSFWHGSFSHNGWTLISFSHWEPV